MNRADRHAIQEHKADLFRQAAERQAKLAADHDDHVYLTAGCPDCERTIDACSEGDAALAAEWRANAARRAMER